MLQGMIMACLCLGCCVHALSWENVQNCQSRGGPVFCIVSLVQYKTVLERLGSMDVSLELIKPSSLSPTMRSRATYSFRLGRSLESDKPSSSIPTYACIQGLYIQSGRIPLRNTATSDRACRYVRDGSIFWNHPPRLLSCLSISRTQTKITVISARTCSWLWPRKKFRLCNGWQPGIESAHEWML